MGLAADLIEALGTEGVEVPTPLQAGVMPVIRRGGSVLLEGGPGGGTLVAYGAALLDRLEEPSRQSVLIATTGDTESDALARSLAPIAEVRGASVAALGSHWATPTDACILFGSVDRLVDLLRLSELDLENVQALVCDGTAVAEGMGKLEGLTLLAEALPGVQKVFVGLPISPAVEALARRTADKPVHIPPRAVEAEGAAPATGRGTLQYRLVAGRRLDHLVNIVHERIERAGREHVAISFRTEDQAADVGDEIATRGFTVGAPGDLEARVWLCPPSASELPQVEDPITVVGYEAPVGPEALTTLYASHTDCIVLVEARELPHLRDTAGRAGFDVRVLPVRPSERADAELLALERRLRARLKAPGLTPFLLLAERLAGEQDPLEVASAALALALETGPTPSAAPRERAEVGAQAPPAAASWTKLFLSIGSKDQVGPGDLLGAITGESGISGSQVGRIDIHETYTLLDVQTAQAEKVMKALNGTTIRGRSIRADFDRGQKKSRPRGGPRGGRGRGPRTPRPQGNA